MEGLPGLYRCELEETDEQRQRESQQQMGHRRECRRDNEQMFELGANLDVGGVQLLLHHLLQNSQG